MGLIQFSDLAELCEELPACHTTCHEVRRQREVADVVRVAVLKTTAGLDKRLGIRLVGIGVHVRAFDAEGHILACYVPAAMVRMMGDTCLDDPGGTKGTYEAAWQKARALGNRVREHLAGRGLTVRPGIIDIGEARPLAGGWREDPHRPDAGNTPLSAEGGVPS